MSDAAVTRPRLRLWLALLGAAAGGLLLDAAGPGLGWWPLTFPAVGLVLAALWQQRGWRGALVGAVAGFAFWGPHISWLTLYLGPLPWIGLSGIMTLWFALLGAGIGFATDGLARLPVLRERPGVLLVAQAVTATGLWVLREGLQGVWPYGGFAWGRVAHTQASGALAESVSWLGFAGLTAAIVLVSGLGVSAAFLAPGAPARLARRRGTRRAACGGAAALLLVLVLVPAAPLAETGELRVAAVQGNSKSGIFDDRESGDVYRDHVTATEQLLDELEAAGDSVDVIVWPENSAEFDLPGTPLRGMEVAKLARRAGAPIVAGSILQDPDGSYTNSAIVWGADGAAGQRYDKRFPVPFAEYMPNREFFHALAPDLVDLVQLEYSFGQRPAAFDIETADAAVRVGLAICFDITFDAHAEDLVRGGAEVIFAPTNNADFGRTDESAQQLAIARLRAIETGRALVNISTVGTSAIIAPNGSDLAALTPFTADAMVATVPLVEGETPALRFGALIAGGWMLIGGAGLVLGWWGRYEPRRARRS